MTRSQDSLDCEVSSNGQEGSHVPCTPNPKAIQTSAISSSLFTPVFTKATFSSNSSLNHTPTLVEAKETPLIGPSPSSFPLLSQSPFLPDTSKNAIRNQQPAERIAASNVACQEIDENIFYSNLKRKVAKDDVLTCISSELRLDLLLQEELRFKKAEKTLSPSSELNRQKDCQHRSFKFIKNELNKLLNAAFGEDVKREDVAGDMCYFSLLSFLQDGIDYMADFKQIAQLWRQQKDFSLALFHQRILFRSENDLKQIWIDLFLSKLLPIGIPITYMIVNNMVTSPNDILAMICNFLSHCKQSEPIASLIIERLILYSVENGYDIENKTEKRHNYSLFKTETWPNTENLFVTSSKTNNVIDDNEEIGERVSTFSRTLISLLFSSDYLLSGLKCNLGSYACDTIIKYQHSLTGNDLSTIYKHSLCLLISTHDFSGGITDPIQDHLSNIDDTYRKTKNSVLIQKLQKVVSYRKQHDPALKEFLDAHRKEKRNDSDMVSEKWIEIFLWLDVVESNFLKDFLDKSLLSQIEELNQIIAARREDAVLLFSDVFQALYDYLLKTPIESPEEINLDTGDACDFLNTASILRLFSVLFVICYNLKDPSELSRIVQKNLVNGWKAMNVESTLFSLAVARFLSIVQSSFPNNHEMVTQAKNSTVASVFYYEIIASAIERDFTSKKKFRDFFIALFIEILPLQTHEMLSTHKKIICNNSFFPNDVETEGLKTCFHTLARGRLCDLENKADKEKENRQIKEKGLSLVTANLQSFIKAKNVPSELKIMYMFDKKTYFQLFLPALFAFNPRSLEQKEAKIGLLESLKISKRLSSNFLIQYQELENTKENDITESKRIELSSTESRDPEFKKIALASLNTEDMKRHNKNLLGLQEMMNDLLEEIFKLSKCKSSVEKMVLISNLEEILKNNSIKECLMAIFFITDEISEERSFEKVSRKDNNKNLLFLLVELLVNAYCLGFSSLYSINDPSFCALFIEHFLELILMKDYITSLFLERILDFILGDFDCYRQLDDITLTSIALFLLHVNSNSIMNSQKVITLANLSSPFCGFDYRLVFYNSQRGNSTACDGYRNINDDVCLFILQNLQTYTQLQFHCKFLKFIFGYAFSSFHSISLKINKTNTIRISTSVPNKVSKDSLECCLPTLGVKLLHFFAAEFSEDRDLQALVKDNVFCSLLDICKPFSRIQWILLNIHKCLNCGYQSKENVLFQQQEVIHSYFKSTSEDENKRELKNTIHENDGYQANIIFHAMAVHNSYHSHSGKLSSDCHFAKVTQNGTALCQSSIGIWEHYLKQQCMNRQESIFNLLINENRLNVTIGSHVLNNAKIELMMKCFPPSQLLNELRDSSSDSSGVNQELSPAEIKVLISLSRFIDSTFTNSPMESHFKKKNELFTLSFEITSYLVQSFACLSDSSLQWKGHLLSSLLQSSPPLVCSLFVYQNALMNSIPKGEEIFGNYNHFLDRFLEIWGLGPVTSKGVCLLPSIVPTAFTFINKILSKEIRNPNFSASDARMVIENIKNFFFIDGLETFLEIMLIGLCVRMHEEAFGPADCIVDFIVSSFATHHNLSSENPETVKRSHQDSDENTLASSHDERSLVSRPLFSILSRILVYCFEKEMEYASAFLFVENNMTDHDEPEERPMYQRLYEKPFIKYRNLAFFLCVATKPDMHLNVNSPKVPSSLKQKTFEFVLTMLIEMCENGDVWAYRIDAYNMINTYMKSHIFPQFANTIALDRLPKQLLKRLEECNSSLFFFLLAEFS